MPSELDFMKPVLENRKMCRTLMYIVRQVRHFVAPPPRLSPCLSTRTLSMGGQDQHPPDQDPSTPLTRTLCLDPQWDERLATLLAKIDKLVEQSFKDYSLRWHCAYVMQFRKKNISVKKYYCDRNIFLKFHVKTL